MLAPMLAVCDEKFVYEYRIADVFSWGWKSLDIASAAQAL